MADNPTGTSQLEQFPIIDNPNNSVLHCSLNGFDFKLPISLLFQINQTFTPDQQALILQNLYLYSQKDIDDLFTNLGKKLNEFITYGSPLVGSLIAWPLEKMPNEIFTDMSMVFIPYMGQTFDLTAYPTLGKIHPSGKLPADMRGEFVRGWDNGRNITPNNVILSWQHATTIGTAVTDYWGSDGSGGSNTNNTNAIGVPFNNSENERTAVSGSTYDSVKAPNGGPMVGGWTDTSIIGTINTSGLQGTGQAGGNGWSNNNTMRLFDVRPRNVAWNYIVRAK